MGFFICIVKMKTEKDRYICQCEEHCKIDGRGFMERTPAKRSSLFLLELMIAILFFLPCFCGVCADFCEGAHDQPRDTGTEYGA